MSARPLPARARNLSSGACIPFTRAASILPVIGFLDAIGAPTERLLRQARLPLALLEDPEALVPLHLAHRLAVRAARSEGIGDLGLVVRLHTSAFTLGVFGGMLQRALTVYGYL
jgi:hypothetical protein